MTKPQILSTGVGKITFQVLFRKSLTPLRVEQQILPRAAAKRVIYDHKWASEPPKELLHLPSKN
jgi:hypothetical protein